MNFRFKLFLFSLIFCFSKANGQLIEILNSSFEGEPADATVPQGWLPCQPGTTPDILPGFWGVYQDASDGDTYLGLITRHNNTWESITQRLIAPLEKGACYSWSLDLAHADTYSGYNKPLQLRVWISENKCGRGQLIFESPLITHSDWKTYRLKLTPEQSSQYIHIEAFHSDQEFSYQGNILLDRLSAFRGCDKS